MIDRLVYDEVAMGQRFAVASSCLLYVPRFITVRADFLGTCFRMDQYADYGCELAMMMLCQRSYGVSHFFEYFEREFFFFFLRSY